MQTIVDATFQSDVVSETRGPFLIGIRDVSMGGSHRGNEVALAPTIKDLSQLGDVEFRTLVQQWLAANVVNEYAELKGRGGPGDEEIGFDIRVAWETELGKAGWIGLGWPTEFGGRGATVAQQIIWAEEYSRAEAPARVNHMGENLLAPTLIEYGTVEQQQRFLPGILDGSQRWCQGYSEPNAGSDLANVQTRAQLETDDTGTHAG